MKIIVLMDSFKGSLSSMEAGEAVKSGITESDIDADVSVYPFADGGEGTLDAFLAADKGSKRITVPVSDPLGRMIMASYGILSDDTVVIEMAQAAGLYLLLGDEKNPMHTTTRGVGQLIRDAMDRGHRKFIIGIGGSATNDCGAGMMKELGLKIYDKDQKETDDGAKGLSQAAMIDTTSILPELSKCEVLIACDVDNPLCGPNGASFVFAPQKGAGPEDIPKMDKWMASFSDIVKVYFPNADKDAPGAGAAGGVGFSLMTFLGARMQPGAEVLLERTDIEKEIAAADLVITGEGRIDGQTAMGKAPTRIAQMAKKYDKKVIAIGGCLGDGYEKCLRIGIDEVYSVTPKEMDIKEAMKKEVAITNIKRHVCGIMKKG